MSTTNFRNSRSYARVLNARNFIFGDIQKTLNLANDLKIGALNFLLALGLCYIEYWGKLKCGIAKDKGVQ
jgi:hypothetical protein